MQENDTANWAKFGTQSNPFGFHCTKTVYQKYLIWFDFFFNFEQSVNPEKMEATLAWMKKIHAECFKVPNSKEQLECHSMKKKQWKNN